MDLSEDQRNLSDKLSLKLSQHPNILHGSSDHKTESFAAHLSRLCDIKGLYDDESFDYASFDYKRFDYVLKKFPKNIKSMIKTVLDLHGHGISVLKLDDSNIVIHDETVKLCGLVYINASDDTKKNDMQSLVHAIKNLILNKSFLLPLYFDDLVSLMSDYSDSHRDLLLNHMALKSVLERFSFFQESSKISLLKGDTNLKNIYFSVVDNMLRSEKNSEDWTQRIKGLEGPFKDCFEHEQRPSTGYRNTNLDMLRFCRNLAAHLLEHLRKAKYKGKCKGTIEEVDYIIMLYFGDELLSFQKLAHEKGILKYLMPGYTWSSTVPLSPAVPSPVVPPSSAVSIPAAQRQDSYKSRLLGSNGAGRRSAN